MPLGRAIDLTESPYKDLREKYNVNVFNSTDPFYNDRCFVYQLNYVDIPVNSRKDLIFPNISSTCGFSCGLVGMDMNGTVECSCKNPSREKVEDIMQELKETFFDYIYNSSNLGLVTCSVNINIF